MPRLLIALLVSLPLFAKAEEKFWQGNKLTSSQPFPARVLAVESSWGGYRLFMESMGEDEKKYCIAQVWPGGSPRLAYTPVQKKDLPAPGVTTVFLNPPVEVDRFSWSIGVWKIGRIFGAEDCLRKVAAAETEPRGRKDEPAAIEPGVGAKPRN